MILLLKVTYYHCWPFFVLKWLGFKLKIEHFRIFNNINTIIYLESPHQEQSFKKNKKDMSSISKINFISKVYLFLSRSPVTYRFFPQVHTRVSTQKLFRKCWQNGNHHKQLGILYATDTV